MDWSIVPKRRETESLSVSRIGMARYRIRERVGAGRWGGVYGAKDLTANRDVAIKILRPELNDDEVFRHLSRRASQAMPLGAACPHVMAVYECGRTDDGVPFLALEWLPGCSLRDILRGSPIRLERAVRMGVQIADALEAGHREGVVHGDIRPEHVIVIRAGEEDERVKLKGFEVAGLATTAAGAALIRAGTVPDVRAYLAPEQIEGRIPTRQADVYGLGLLLYEMLTGRVPTGREAVEGVDTPNGTAGDTPHPGIPPIELSHLRQALQTRPEQRQQHVRDLINPFLYQRAVEIWEESQTEPSAIRRVVDSVATRVSDIERRRLLLALAAWLVLSMAGVILFVGLPPGSEAPSGDAGPDDPATRTLIERDGTAPVAIPATDGSSQSPVPPATTEAPEGKSAMAESVIVSPPHPAEHRSPAKGSTKARRRSEGPGPRAAKTTEAQPSSRHVPGRQGERVSEAPTSHADPPDGTAIIDWLFKQSPR